MCQILTLGNASGREMNTFGSHVGSHICNIGDFDTYEVIWRHMKVCDMRVYGGMLPVLTKQMGSPLKKYKWLYFLLGVYIFCSAALRKQNIAMVVPREGGRL